MSGLRSNSGPSGLSKNCMSKSAPSSCSMKPQGSEPKKSMSPNARWPAKPMRLNALGWLASLRPGSKVEREKRARRCRKISANSSSIFTPRCPPCQPREIAEVCYIRYGRRPDHKNVKRIATSGPPPSLSARRYQPWHQISDPAERKLAVIRLHADGWSITSIAQYLQCSRHTIYDTLKRWHDEGVAGLDARPKTNKGVRKATLKVRNEIRKLQDRKSTRLNSSHV